MQKPELFVSIDVESDGPCPGHNSMLSLGAALFLAGSETPIKTFYRNFKIPEGMQSDPATMRWWKSNQTAWDAARHDTQEPKDVMLEFYNLLISFSNEYKLVSVEYPGPFDFGFVNYYFHRYVGANPLGFSSISMKTMVWILFGFVRFPNAHKRSIPQHFFDGLLHSHNALEDAIEQGVLFIRLLKYYHQELAQ